jgi:hypothetical protein
MAESNAGQYAGYAQAGASTMGTILDAINNRRNREYNEGLQSLAQWSAERNRQDTLRQQDLTNQQSTQNFGLLKKKTNEDISMGRETLAMQKRKMLRDNLLALTSANPSSVTGVASLFGGK